MNITIVVPLYKSNLSENEMISLRQMKKIFFRRHFTVVCPASIIERAKKLFNDVQFSIVTFQQKMFKSTRTYNRLLMSRSFYESFTNYSHILICQLDVYVFKDELDYWCKSGYHFIGAPSFKGHNSDKTYEFGKTLNGGISIRNVSASLRVLDSIKFRFAPLKYLVSMEYKMTLKLVRLLRDGLIFNYRSPQLLRPIINEDLFWSFIVPNKKKWFTCPQSVEAMKFAFDVHPQYLYNMNHQNRPMAIHAWWRYDEEFVKELAKINFEINTQDNFVTLLCPIDNNIREY